MENMFCCSLTEEKDVFVIGNYYQSKAVNFPGPVILGFFAELLFFPTQPPRVSDVDIWSQGALKYVMRFCNCLT